VESACRHPSPGAEERADERQEVTEHLADACRQVPEVLEEVEDGIHAALIPEEASDGNPS